MQMEATLVKQIEVVVEKDALTASINTGDHQLIIDEPEEEGGKNLGPDPYDFILSALGACTAITLRLYAQRKQWPLEKITVKLSRKKIYPDDCLNCEQDAAKLDYIEKTLLMEGNLSTEQRERLKIISEKCPVQKTLVSGISIQTKI
jgi:putative redox protein